jgi:DNA invertase Pin-like site-specific DNA recombinase
MKAALYTQVSTVSRSRHGEQLVFNQRPEMQEELLRTHAERRGWSVIRVYTDRICGPTDVRPSFDGAVGRCPDAVAST